MKCWKAISIQPIQDFALLRTSAEIALVNRGDNAQSHKFLLAAPVRFCLATFENDRAIHATLDATCRLGRACIPMTSCDCQPAFGRPA